MAVSVERSAAPLGPSPVVALVIMQESSELFPQPIRVTRRAYGCSGLKDLALNIHRQLVPQQQDRRTEAVQYMTLRIGERHRFGAFLLGQSPQRATLTFPSGEGAKIDRASGPRILIAHTVEYEPERWHPPAERGFAPKFMRLCRLPILRRNIRRNDPKILICRPLVCHKYRRHLTLFLFMVICDVHPIY